MLTGDSRKLPHALFCPSLRLKSFHPRDGATDLTRVETFPGAACLRKICGHTRLRSQIAGSPITCQSGSPPGPSPPAWMFLFLLVLRFASKLLNAAKDRPS